MNASTEPERIAVAFACDENAVQLLAVAIRTLVARGDVNRGLEIHVFSSGLSESTKARLIRVAIKAGYCGDIRWYEISQELFADLNTKWVGSQSTYYRLIIPDLIETVCARVLYLDCDIMVRGSLRELCHTSLNEMAVGAVRDVSISVHGDRTTAHDRSIEYSGRPYFNAGVLLIDRARWACVFDVQAAIEWARIWNPTNNDQDVLNVFLADQWHPLSEEWNVCGELLRSRTERMDEYQSSIRRRRVALVALARVYHFAGHPKPSQPWCADSLTLEWNWQFASCGGCGVIGVLKCYSGWIPRWLLQRVKSLVVRPLCCQ